MSSFDTTTRLSEGTGRKGGNFAGRSEIGRLARSPAVMWSSPIPSVGSGSWTVRCQPGFTGRREARPAQASLDIAEIRSLQQHPRADERRNVAELDPSSFGRRQEADGVQIDE